MYFQFICNIMLKCCQFLEKQNQYDKNAIPYNVCKMIFCILRKDIKCFEH